MWAFARDDPRPMQASIDRLLQYEISVIDFDHDCAKQFGSLRIERRRHGIEVGTTDLMIASVALLHDLTLVTHNTADFQNIPGLRMEDWLRP